MQIFENHWVCLILRLNEKDIGGVYYNQSTFSQSFFPKLESLITAGLLKRVISTFLHTSSHCKQTQDKWLNAHILHTSENK